MSVWWAPGRWAARSPAAWPERRRHRRGRPRRAAADGAPGFRRPRLCHRRRLARACSRTPAFGRCSPMPVVPDRRIRVSDGRIGRRPSRLHLHFDVGDVGGERVRLDGRGAQPAHGAQRAPARAAGPRGPRPGGGARSNATADGATVAHRRRPDDRLPAGGRRRRARERRCGEPPAFRSRAGLMARPASSARSRTNGRTTASRSSISCPPARSPNCRWPPPTARPTSRPSSGPSGPRSPIACWRSTMPLSPARSPAGSATISAPSGRSAGAGATRSAPCTRTATGPTRLALVGDAAHGIHPDRRAGPESRLARRRARSPSWSSRRCRAGEDPGAPALLARYQRAAPAGQPRDAGRDRRARPAVQHRSGARCAWPATSASPPSIA